MSEFFKASDFEICLRDLESVALRANGLLQSRGTVVYGTAEKVAIGQFEMHLKRYDWVSHQALLINIEKIESPDTPEKVLRDLVNHIPIDMRSEESRRFAKIIERARRVLAK